MGKTIRGENKSQIKKARRNDKEFRQNRRVVIKVERDDEE